MSKPNSRIGTIGVAVMLLVATSMTANAQQRGMMQGRMHGDTAPAAMRCPGGPGGMGMMQGHRMRGGMHGMPGTMSMMRGMGPGMMGGHRMMGANPSMLLAQGDVLELTDDQVARLEKLQEEQAMMRGMHEGMTAARSQMRDAMAADSLDMEAYRKAVEAMADQMTGHHMQMARFHEQVLNVLTPGQRGKVRTGMQMMRHMMDGSGMGGPMH